MTGRELVNFIFENNLEDVEVFSKGHLIGYLSEDEAAVKFNIQPGAVRAWVNTGKIEGFNVNGMVYIPVCTQDPRIADRSLI